MGASLLALAKYIYLASEKNHSTAHELIDLHDKISTPFDRGDARYKNNNNNTRNSRAYRLPYCRTNTKEFSPFFQGY